MSKILNKFISSYTSEPVPGKRLGILLDFIDYYNYSNFQPIAGILRKELADFAEQNYADGIALIRTLFAYVSFEKGDFEKARQKMEWVDEIFDKVTQPEIKAQILNFQAFLHSHLGNYDKAFECCYASIREAELAADKRFYYWGSYTLGVFYFDLKDYSNSGKYFQEGVEGFLKHENQYGAARCVTGLSSICIATKQYEEAELLLHRSLRFYNEVDEIPGQSRSLNDLGVILQKTGKPGEALHYFEQSLLLRKKINHTQGIATTLNEISEVLIMLREYGRAESYLQEAKEICERIKNKSKLYRTHFLFTQVYRQTNQPWKALEHYDLFEKLKAEVVGETANNKMQELQTRMITEKADRENEIERLKNVELKMAYDIIGEKNKAITDSINYAKRIQWGILPSEAELEHCLKDYFVLYRPKDIVSGDFYWCESIYSPHLNTMVCIVAVIDCTGHGVPGALMSILGYTLLNQAIKHPDTKTVADVLHYLMIELPQILKSKEKDDSFGEGMDISLCMIDHSTSKLHFAGANQPIWFIRHQSNEVEEIKGTKTSIGRVTNEPQHFQVYEIPFHKGDTFYLLTDGYADQFGGPDNKRLTTRKLKQELASIQSKSMPDQEKHLNSFLKSWRGNSRQVDDILVLGIRM